MLFTINCGGRGQPVAMTVCKKAPTVDGNIVMKLEGAVYYFDILHGIEMNDNYTYFGVSEAPLQIITFN